jgi:hypothetical protein
MKPTRKSVLAGTDGIKPGDHIVLFFPASTLRRDLILRFALCFFLMAAGVLFVGIARIHQNGWPGR